MTDKDVVTIPPKNHPFNCMAPTNWPFRPSFLLTHRTTDTQKQKQTTDSNKYKKYNLQTIKSLASPPNILVVISRIRSVIRHKDNYHG